MTGVWDDIMAEGMYGWVIDRRFIVHFGAFSQETGHVDDELLGVSPESTRTVDCTVLTLPNGQLRKVSAERQLMILIFGFSEGSQNTKRVETKGSASRLTPGNVACPYQEPTPLPICR